MFARSDGAAVFEQLHELGESAIWPFTGYRSANYLLTLEPGTTTEIVVRLHTRTPVGFHLQLSTMSSFMAADRKQLVAAAFLTAVPLVVLIYVTILAAVLRHTGLAGLMVMLIAKLLMDAWVSGFGLLLLPFVPRAFWSTLGFVLVMIYSIASVVHIRQFLDLRRTAPYLDTILRGFAGLFLLLCVVEITHLANVRPVSQALAPLALLIFVAAAVRHAWRERNIGAACYALAWVLVLAQTVMQFSRLIALLPFRTETLEFAQSAMASILFGVAIFRRVRDRDRTLNRSLAETNERFRLAIEGSAAAIYEYSFADGRFSFAPRLSQMIPVPHDTSLAETLKRLPRRTRCELIGGIRQAVRNMADQFRIEISLDRGSQQHVYAVNGAIQYEQESARRIIGSVIDITSERALAIEQRLTSALAREKEQVERSLAARTIFYAAANHDLRHPLLSLGLYLQMLAKDRTRKKLDEFLPRMLEAHRSAFDYVDLILDLARSDTNAVAVSPKTQPLQPIFSKLIDRYRADAAQAGLSLRCVPTDRSILTDAFLLDRILSNLLSNAIRHTKKGGVLLGCRRMHDGIRIDVVDTGPGLAPDIHQRIMRNGANGALPHDTGMVQLGLIIVQRTASELGCSIDMATWPGKGTRFSVVIR